MKTATRDVAVSYRVPIHIGRLAEHDRIKAGVLRHIQSQPFWPYAVETSYITRCDYEAPKATERGYLRLVRRPIHEHIRRVMAPYGYRSLKVYNFFFQHAGRATSSCFRASSCTARPATARPRRRRSSRSTSTATSPAASDPQCARAV